jgi:hypothetical protein
MDVKESPFAFFGKQTLRLRDLQVQEKELTYYPIPTLLQKRNGVVQIYQSFLAHMLDVPADYFPGRQQVLSKFPRDPDVVVCYTRMFPNDCKAAAIGLVAYRFSRLLKSIDEAGGPELAVLVNQDDNQRVDSSLSLMLDAVRTRLAVRPAEEIPENEPSSSYESYASEQTGVWQKAASLSSSDAEEEDDFLMLMGNQKRTIRVHGDLEKSEFRSDAEVGDSDLIAFISLSGLDSWGSEHTDQ